MCAFESESHRAVYGYDFISWLLPRHPFEWFGQVFNLFFFGRYFARFLVASRWWLPEVLSDVSSVCILFQGLPLRFALWTRDPLKKADDRAIEGLDAGLFIRFENDTVNRAVRADVDVRRTRVLPDFLHILDCGFIVDLKRTFGVSRLTATVTTSPFLLKMVRWVAAQDSLNDTGVFGDLTASASCLVGNLGSHWLTPSF